jgi:dihydropyrimidinase
MTCESSIQALRRGRAQGYPVMGESCTQYFFLTVEDHLAAPGFEGAKYVCSPPIRSTYDQGILWQAIKDGTLQHVSTDHCNFWFEGGSGPWQEWAAAHTNGQWNEFEAQDPTYRRPGKELGKGNFSKIPNGMPGLEERMMVMWEHGVNAGRISPSRLRPTIHWIGGAGVFRFDRTVPGSQGSDLSSRFCPKACEISCCRDS